MVFLSILLHIFLPTVVITRHGQGGGNFLVVQKFYGSTHKSILGIVNVPNLTDLN